MNSSPLCVDANLVIRLVADPGDERVRSAWEQWDADNRRIAAPTLLFYEVSNALYRYQRAGMMSGAAVRLALEEENIEARPVWKPMHLQPVFQVEGLKAQGSRQEKRKTGTKLVRLGSKSPRICLIEGCACRQAPL